MPETYAVKFGQKDSKLFLFLLRIEEHLCSSFAHRIICVNHIQRNMIITRGISSEKIDIALNVPDEKKFYITEKKERKKGNVRMVYHGTIAKRLGIDLAIEAFSQVIEKVPQIEFHILGQGDDLEEFSQTASKLGVDRNIHFSRKMLPLEELPAILNTMDIGIVANRKNVATELMLPVKMLEYIAMDIPVVVPRLKTIEYYFTDDMVSFFEPEDIDSLASAILKLIGDRNKRKKQVEEARRFLEQYGWKKHKLDFINIYKKLEEINN